MSDRPLTDDERALVGVIKTAHQALEIAWQKAKTIDPDAYRDLTYALDLIESRLGVYGRRDMIERLQTAARSRAGEGDQ